DPQRIDGCQGSRRRLLALSVVDLVVQEDRARIQASRDRELREIGIGQRGEGFEKEVGKAVVDRRLRRTEEHAIRPRGLQGRDGGRGGFGLPPDPGWNRHPRRRLAIASARLDAQRLATLNATVPSHAKALLYPA